MEKTEFMVEVQSLGESQRPVVITQNEWMRRMKEMSRFQQGMNFYAQMPDSLNLVLNSDHPLVKRVLDDCKTSTEETLKPILSELKGQEARLAAIRQQQDKKKPEELTQDDKDMKAECEKAAQEGRCAQRLCCQERYRSPAHRPGPVAKWYVKGRGFGQVPEAFG